jgi:class 3 adenylate cyclase
VKPDVRYTWNDGFGIAYQVLGRGRSDLIYLPGFASNVDLQWDIPPYARFLERLATSSRLILLDHRGIGCSDRFPPGGAATLEEIADDVLAVMEALSSMRATIFAVQESVFPALLLAASQPMRVSRLILFGGSPSWVQSDDLPDEWSAEFWESEIRSYERLSSAVESMTRYNREAAPSLADDEQLARQLVSLTVNSLGPAASAAEVRILSQVDLRHVLPSISVPTLVLSREGDSVVSESSSRFLADHIAGARYAELPGRDTLPWIGDTEPIHAQIEDFLEIEHSEPASTRRLATVLFTDLVDSSARALALGDAAWSRLLADHHRAVRRELAAHGGTEVDTAGDGFFATFPGPAQGVRCASSISRAVTELGIGIRVGVHTGEVETVDGKPGGTAVHVGARIAALAEPAEVLVSQTVKDLAVGSGIRFEDPGEHELKGIPDPWRIYRVAAAATDGV